MDKDGSGQIDIKDVAELYDVSKNPDYIQGKKTEDEVLMDFLNQFDGMKGNNDGKISWDEWLEYYTELSMSTPSDQYFVTMMEQAWCIAENEDNAEFASKVNGYIQRLQQNVATFAKGGNPEIVKKVFDDFDTNQSKTLTSDQIGNMMYKFEIAVERKFI
jgi:Ca2+-binding EF-hand superfamily protein